DWKDTLNTLHMWLQIVGKVKLALCPFLNQWWEVALYVTASGITSGLIPYNEEAFQVDFNFVVHTLTIYTTTGKSSTLSLQARSVSAFYAEFMQVLETMGITIAIWPVPVEVPHPLRFADDIKHASYEKEYVQKWWQILIKTCIVFEQFRTSFRGKSSP